MRITVFFFILLLACAGCPESPHAYRIVAVDYPAPTGQAGGSISSHDPTVIESCKIIDEVLLAHGFVRDVNPPESAVDGFVASYSKRDAAGLVPISDHPIVWFKDNQLEVIFNEGRASGGHVGAYAKGTVDLLQAELKNRYGSKMITAKLVEQ